MTMHPQHNVKNGGQRRAHSITGGSECSTSGATPNLRVRPLVGAFLAGFAGLGASVAACPSSTVGAASGGAGAGSGVAGAGAGAGGAASGGAGAGAGGAASGATRNLRV